MRNQFTKLSSLFVLLCGVLTAAEIEQLAGDLPRTVSAKKSPYLVTSDIFVPSGKTVVIEQGTIFLFKNFTTLHVQGVLSAKGGSSTPIVFTSENDRNYNQSGKLNPTPYDWNGIYIHKDAIGTDLENVRVMYSVKGIVSETRFLKITDALFKENGRSNLSIEGLEKPVSEEPYSYSLSIKDARVDGVPIKILQDPDAPRRNAIRYSSIVAFVGGSVLGGMFTHEYIQSRNDLNSLSSQSFDNLMDNDISAWQTAKNKRDLNLAIMIVGYAIAAAGGTAFSLVIFFLIRRCRVSALNGIGC